MGREEEFLEEMGFSKKAIGYIRDERNIGSVENPSVVATYQGECGDIIEMSLAIEKGRITDARFQLTGCAGLRASGSILTERLKGMTLESAKEITADDIFKEIPEKKHDCAEIAVNVLKEAIKMYTAKEK